MVVAEIRRRYGGAGTFFRHVFTSRWFMVFACLLIMSMSGAAYIFGIYSNDVKTALGYDQTTLNLVGFFKDLGCNIGVISGVINEVSPPWVVLAIGLTMNFAGYFMIWLAVAGRIAKPQLWQMCLYIFIGANSQTFSNTGALVTCVKNFPESRGIVIGLLKGFTGLSGAIITQIYRGFYGNDSTSLILLIAWLPAAVSFLFLRTIRLMKPAKQENELQVFYNLLFASLGLAGVLMLLIILQNGLSFTGAASAGFGSVVLILLFAPLAIVFREEFKLWRSKNFAGTDSTSPLTVMVKESPTPPPKEEEKKSPPPWWRDILNPPERGEDYTIPQALCSVDMIILFISVTFGAGGALSAMDNLGQIGKALGYPAKSISTFVSLVSIWGYLGRVGSGFSSEIFLAKYGFPRPLMLTLVLLLACSGHVLVAFGVPHSLYAASIIIGFCFGAMWPLIFAIISELFGLKYYSTLYSLGGASSPLGAYIFNVKVTGYLYDREAMIQMAEKGLVRHDGQDLTCIGVHCYKLAFLIITASTFIGCVVSFLLVIRTRRFYKGDIYKKFRAKENSET